VSEVDPEAFKHWTPAAQEKALTALKERTARDWRPFYCPDPNCDGLPHGDWDFKHARADQRPPTDPNWLVWLLRSGRGAGKTRTGAEFTHRVTRKLPRIALVAGTATDAREIMLEGISGIMTIAPPDHRPVYEPSKKRLTWPNGAIATVFSGEEPDRLRGPEHYYAWLDEPAHWPLIQECWDNLMFGMRLGNRPRIVCTTTPKSRPWLKELTADPDTRVTSVSTYTNLDNLSPVFAERVIARYEGTRLGRQELHGELLLDVEGALWTWDMIEEGRMLCPDRFDRVVVAVDPAGTSNRRSDETGIIVAGSIGDEVWILADRSGKYSPHGWAKATESMYEFFQADAIVAEVNFGADMVISTLRGSGVKGRIISQRSARGKELRAEPVVGLYEQNKVHHVDVFEDLEAQMTEWVPHESRDSPDRIDALVFAVTELAGRAGKMATVASPTKLPKRSTEPAIRHHLQGARR
jgi:phage terminase large subunit-like protein